MKNILLTLLAVCSLSIVQAQLKKDPVAWTFTVSKKSADTYVVTASAKVPKPWHIYSQNTPAGGPVPTSIKFKANPLVTIVGSAKENGKMQKVFDENFGVDVLYYSNELVLSQEVKVKNKVKTTISGTVEYMVCDDKECLPPTRKSFEVNLQ